MTHSDAQRLLRLCKRQARLNPDQPHWLVRVREWETLIAKKF